MTLTEWPREISTLTHEIVTVACGGRGAHLRGGHFEFDSALDDTKELVPWDHPVREIDNRDNRRSPAECYQLALEQTGAEILIMVHDDLDVEDEDWLARVLRIFEDREDCVAVGLGGAPALGNLDMYRKPFALINMARRGYMSNATDAEVHGARFTGARQVAVIEQFCMALRVDWLRRRGGWPVERLTHHCLDLWLACEAARDWREIWMVGARLTHHGGGSSTGHGYAGASWLQGGTIAQDHQIPHRWIWDEYRDVLPLEVR